jgi:AraC-like DNA-binding protein
MSRDAAKSLKERIVLPARLEGRAWSLNGNSYHFAMHRHEELEVNLVTRGRATYLLANRRYDLRPGSQIWLFPDENHVLLNLSPDYEMWLAIFTPTLLRRTCASETYRVLTARTCAGQSCRRLEATTASRMESLFHDIAMSTNDPDRCNAGLAYLLLASWRAQEAADVPIGRNVHPAVEKAATLIRDEAVPMKLSVLARQAGLSSSRLSYLFKQQTGVSLVQFRQRQQLERFLRLYGGGKSHTLLSAALDAGFGSYPQFHRVFKACMGTSPAKYRRQIRERNQRGE